MVQWQVPSTKATCCGFESENQPLPKHKGFCLNEAMNVDGKIHPWQLHLICY